MKHALQTRDRQFEPWSLGFPVDTSQVIAESRKTVDCICGSVRAAMYRRPSHQLVWVCDTPGCLHHQQVGDEK